MREELPRKIEKICPPEIREKQTKIEVAYFDFKETEHKGLIEIHLDVQKDVIAFFELAYSLRFPIERVALANDPEFNGDDDKLMTANASSGFNYRLIAGTKKLSMHSKGLAFDINPKQNPYIRYENGQKIIAPLGAKYDPYAPGTLSESHVLVKFMEGRGWEWGGNWPPKSGRTDYHHFQFTPKDD